MAPTTMQLLQLQQQAEYLRLREQMLMRSRAPSPSMTRMTEGAVLLRQRLHHQRLLEQRLFLANQMEADYLWEQREHKILRLLAMARGGAMLPSPTSILPSPLGRQTMDAAVSMHGVSPLSSRSFIASTGSMKGSVKKVVPTKAVTKPPIKKFRRKPKDQPRRALSAYNIFFKDERQRILDRIPDPVVATDGDEISARKRNNKKSPHGKIGFESLAKMIGQRWQEIGPEEIEYYKVKADEDKKRYQEEMDYFINSKKKFLVSTDLPRDGENDGDGQMDAVDDEKRSEGSRPTKKLRT